MGYLNDLEIGSFDDLLDDSACRLKRNFDVLDWSDIHLSLC